MGPIAWQAGGAALLAALLVHLAGPPLAAQQAGQAAATPAAARAAESGPGAAAPGGAWSTESRPAAGPRRPVPSPAAKVQKAPAKSPAAKAGVAATITAVEIAGDARVTTVGLQMSSGVTAEVYTLANPYRVIIDLPEVEFRLTEASGRTATGLVSAYRYGLFSAGKARVVIDTAGPVKVDKAAMAHAAGGIRFDLALAPVSAAEFGAGTGAGKLAQELKPAVGDEAVPRTDRGAKPVIVVDAGHGGIDPGAVGSSTIYEKHVVLAVAKQLRSLLAASGRYDVVMTRDRDVFVALDQRVQISRTAGADLFLSLHADSIEAKALAANIRGATIYTLSERASDEEARRMAEKENASDALAGIATVEAGGSDQVRSILIDLMKRETANFSAAFSSVLSGTLGKSVAMAKDAQRSAAFKVLRQPHSPSVLIELGYMSNAEDEKAMGTAEWQRKVATSIAGAVDAYFAKHAARSR